MYYYLLYFGIARKKFTLNDFKLLLEQARSRNEKLDITGKLLHCEDTFIQLLEGTKEAVELVYKSITNDERLIAIKVIATGHIKERYYADWDMAFSNITLAEINKLENCDHPNVKEYIESSSAVRLLKVIARA